MHPDDGVHSLIQVVVWFKGKNVNGSPCKVVVNSEADHAHEPDFSLKKEIVKKSEVELHRGEHKEEYKEPEVGLHRGKYKEEYKEYKVEKNEDKEVKALVPSLGMLDISGQVKGAENKAKIKVSHDMTGEARIRNVEMLSGKVKVENEDEGSKAMEKVKKQLRSVLIPHKNGLLLDDVNKEYREMVSQISCSAP